MTDVASAPIVCFGELLLRLASPGKELLLQSARLDAQAGGAEANVAVSLSKLGHRTVMVSALPDSQLGRWCAAELRRHGVGAESIRFGDGRMGLYFLAHGAGNRPAEVLYDRLGSAFETAPADAFDWPSLLAGASWLHVSGITPAVGDGPAAAALAAVATARDLNVKVSFDCNFRARLWGPRTREAPQLLRRLGEHANVMFGDERDIALMLGFEPDGVWPERKRRQAANAAFDTFAHLELIACTSRVRHSADFQQLTGLLLSRHETCTTRPFNLYGIVDRIGAGDAFAAGVLHGLLNGFDPQHIVDFGTAAACLKHSIPGDFNLATDADIRLLLSEQQMDVRR